MTVPKLNLVLPVYNGENFVRQAIDSVLSQTYREFEFIISDNGSTDATEQICRSYAAADSRIRYIRHSQNRGASWNHKFGFEQTRCEYVKFIAHDDAWEPTMLEESVRVLDEHPEVVVVYPRTVLIDENNDIIEYFDPKLSFSSPRPSDRLRSAVWGRHRAYPIFGMARRDAYTKTKLLQPFVDADRVWLARLALIGPFYEIPEFLFRSRMHGARYGSQASRPATQLAWFDPKKKRRFVFPTVRLFFEYLRAAWQADIRPLEKLECLYVVATCFRKKWWRSKLREDFVRPLLYVAGRFRRPAEV